MKETIRNLCGLIAGVCFGLVVTEGIAYAQTITKYKIDPANAVCWDQPHTSLASVNQMKVRVTYDATPASDVAFTCTGAASPFLCKLTATVPMSAQSVGVHRIQVDGANLDPIDNTYTAYANLIDYQVDFANAAQPPQKGGNGRIVKIVQAIAQALADFWKWLT